MNNSYALANATCVLTPGIQRALIRLNRPTEQPQSNYPVGAVLNPGTGTLQTDCLHGDGLKDQ